MSQNVLSVERSLISMPKRKSGRKGKEKERELMNLYSVFHKWQIIYKGAPKGSRLEEVAQKWAEELDYAKLTDVAFAEKHNISRETCINWKKNSTFWDIFYEEVLVDEKGKLPIVLNIMTKKNPEAWMKIVWPKQAKKAFTNKYEHSGLIGIDDAKSVLGNAFEVVKVNKDNLPKKKLNKDEL